MILAATGAASLAISFTRYGVWAAMVYTTLPLTIGWFARRHSWDAPIEPTE
jgi:ABC-type sulfate transport system permease component